MRVEMQPIHIIWEGPFRLNELGEFGQEKDYGIYQIYGSHVLYGDNCLLYIGQANFQNFKVRLNQHEWVKDNAAGSATHVRIGRLGGYADIRETEWGKLINVAEQLLVYAHAPAYNTQFLGSINLDLCRDYHIINWYEHGNLLPEVTGYAYCKDFDDTDFRAYRLL